MKAMLHGLPQCFITVDRHCKKGEVWTWAQGANERKFEVYKCDPINRENQLQNVYLTEIKEEK